MLVRSSMFNGHNNCKLTVVCNRWCGDKEVNWTHWAIKLQKQEEHNCKRHICPAPYTTSHTNTHCCKYLVWLPQHRCVMYPWDSDRPKQHNNNVTQLRPKSRTVDNEGNITAAWCSIHNISGTKAAYTYDKDIPQKSEQSCVHWDQSNPCQCKVQCLPEYTQ